MALHPTRPHVARAHDMASYNARHTTPHGNATTHGTTWQHHTTRHHYTATPHHMVTRPHHTTRAVVVAVVAHQHEALHAGLDGGHGAAHSRACLGRRHQALCQRCVPVVGVHAGVGAVVPRVVPRDVGATAACGGADVGGWRWLVQVPTAVVVVWWRKYTGTQAHGHTATRVHGHTSKWATTWQPGTQEARAGLVSWIQPPRCPTRTLCGSHPAPPHSTPGSPPPTPPPHTTTPAPPRQSSCVRRLCEGRARLAAPLDGLGAGVPGPGTTHAGWPPAPAHDGQRHAATARGGGVLGRPAQAHGRQRRVPRRAAAWWAGPPHAARVACGGVAPPPQRQPPQRRPQPPPLQPPPPPRRAPLQPPAQPPPTLRPPPRAPEPPPPPPPPRAACIGGGAGWATGAGIPARGRVVRLRARRRRACGGQRGRQAVLQQPPRRREQRARWPWAQRGVAWGDVRRRKNPPHPTLHHGPILEAQKKLKKLRTPRHGPTHPLTPRADEHPQQHTHARTARAIRNTVQGRQ